MIRQLVAQGLEASQRTMSYGYLTDSLDHVQKFKGYE